MKGSWWTCMALLLASCGHKNRLIQPVAPPPPPVAQGPTEMVRLDGTEPVVGDPAARFTIVQYSDFLCPHCANAFEQLTAYVDAHPDTKIVFKTMPLSMECNPSLGVSTVPDRCTLAYAAECGTRSGKFRATAGAIFGDIGTISATGATPDALAKIAGKAGLDPAGLMACVADPAIRDAVIADANEGMRLRIAGTPTFWLTRTDLATAPASGGPAAAPFEILSGAPGQITEKIDTWRTQ